MSLTTCNVRTCMVTQVASPYGSHMGPIWVPIWAPYGHAHMGPMKFCTQAPCGAHMGNPRWPIWAESGAQLGPIWVNYMGYIWGKCGLSHMAIVCGMQHGPNMGHAHMGPMKFCTQAPCGAHMGNPRWPIWVESGAQMGPIWVKYMGYIWGKYGLSHMGIVCGMQYGPNMGMPHMGPMKFCTQAPCGAHMGNPRWPIWVMNLGPNWGPSG